MFRFLLENHEAVFVLDDTVLKGSGGGQMERERGYRKEKLQVQPLA